MHIMKRYEDNGSPCLIPLEGKIGSRACNTAHYDFYKIFRNINPYKHIPDEAPF